jgi:hypothetical protein
MFEEKENKKQTQRTFDVMRQTRFAIDRRMLAEKKYEKNFHCLLRKTHKHVNQFC